MRLLRLLFAFTIALCLIFPIVVYAHPGRTDSEGGHYDRSTGEYHYHHGNPAHDHYDMDGDGVADCPYDFDDKTGSSSNESSNSLDVDKFQKELERLEKEKANATKPANKHKNSEKVPEKTTTFFDQIWSVISHLFEILLFCAKVFFCWLCLFGACWIIEKIWKKIKK